MCVNMSELSVEWCRMPVGELAIYLAIRPGLPLPEIQPIQMISLL